MASEQKGRGRLQQDRDGAQPVRNSEIKKIVRAVDGNFLYIGRSTELNAPTSSPLWQIERLEYTRGVVVRKVFANDDRDYGNVWDSRTTYFTPTTPTGTESDIAPDSSVFSEAWVRTRLTLVSTIAQEAKVGASPLVRRKMLRIENDSNKTIFIGPDNTVTISGATRGEILSTGDVAILTLGPELTAWIVSSGNTGTDDILIEEFS